MHNAGYSGAASGFNPVFIRDQCLFRIGNSPPARYTGFTSPSTYIFCVLLLLIGHFSFASNSNIVGMLKMKQIIN